MKTWFTSDWHLGEDRIGINGKPNVFYRPFFSVVEQDACILKNFVMGHRRIDEDGVTELYGFENGDTLWHLGDVLYNEDDKWLDYIKHNYPDSKFNLIIGNYDEDKLSILNKYFDIMVEEATIMIKDKAYYLNHYPAKCIEKSFSITGHVHSYWKVQKNMINVGVDAWHFKPVSEDEIDFCRTACEKYYDKNVFPY